MQGRQIECPVFTRISAQRGIDLLGTRYSNLRQFAPKFLKSFAWRRNREADKLLAGIEVLRKMNAAGLRKLPEDAPREFIPAKWGLTSLMTK